MICLFCTELSPTTIAKFCSFWVTIICPPELFWLCSSSSSICHSVCLWQYVLNELWDGGDESLWEKPSRQTIKQYLLIPRIHTHTHTYINALILIWIESCPLVILWKHREVDQLWVEAITGKLAGQWANNRTNNHTATVADHVMWQMQWTIHIKRYVYFKLNFIFYVASTMAPDPPHPLKPGTWSVVSFISKKLFLHITISN